MVGIDLILVSRVKEQLGNDKFYDRILNETEIKYLRTYKKANLDVEAKSVAGFFAAKEAILKAFGVGITNGYGFKDITIYHDEFNAPIVKLSKKLNNLMIEKNCKSISVSISHDGDYATAIAIIE